MSQTLEQLREEIAELRLALERLAHRVDSAGAPSEHPISPPELPEPPEPVSLQAASLAIHSPDGATPIQIRAENDRAGIYFYDKQNACRALMELTAKGVRFCLLSAEGNPIVSLKGIDGHGQLCVASPDGIARAAIRSTKHGGVVKVLNAHGRPLGFLFGAESGGVIELNNQAHRTGVSLFAEDDGGMLRLHQGGGEVMASISAHDDSGMLTVFGNLGEQAITLCASEDGGHVLICDVDGDVRTELT